MECIGNAVFSRAVSFREYSVYKNEGKCMPPLLICLLL